MLPPPGPKAPRAQRLAGNRLHLTHGPIDLVIAVFGPPAAVERAYRAATTAFDGLLDSLVAVLPRLRQPVGDADGLPPTARLMHAATAPFANRFITPMAAVAGAVADTVLSVIRATPGIERAFVNNRGDIAVHLTPGQVIDIGVVPELRRPLATAALRLRHGQGIGGVATSGWDGRSFSLGIADAVTVLAATAAQADAAATLIANAVDIDHAAIQRAPARSSRPRQRPRRSACDHRRGPARRRSGCPGPGKRGTLCDSELLDRGLIRGALLALQGRVRTVGGDWEEIACSS